LFPILWVNYPTHLSEDNKRRNRDYEVWSVDAYPAQEGLLLFYSLVAENGVVSSRNNLYFIVLENLRYGPREECGARNT
jgi:hypothetical protein